MKDFQTTLLNESREFIAVLAKQQSQTSILQESRDFLIQMEKQNLATHEAQLASEQVYNPEAQPVAEIEQHSESYNQPQAKQPDFQYAVAVGTENMFALSQQNLQLNTISAEPNEATYEHNEQQNQQKDSERPRHSKLNTEELNQSTNYKMNDTYKSNGSFQVELDMKDIISQAQLIRSPVKEVQGDKMEVEQEQLEASQSEPQIQWSKSYQIREADQILSSKKVSNYDAQEDEIIRKSVQEGDEENGIADSPQEHQKSIDKQAQNNVQIQNTTGCASLPLEQTIQDDSISDQNDQQSEHADESLSDLSQYAESPNPFDKIKQEGGREFRVIREFEVEQQFVEDPNKSDNDRELLQENKSNDDTSQQQTQYANEIDDFSEDLSRYQDMGQDNRPTLDQRYQNAISSSNNVISSSANVIVDNEEDSILHTPKVTKIENDYEDQENRTEILEYESDNKSEEECMRIEDDEDPKQHEIDGEQPEDEVAHKQETKRSQVYAADDNFNSSSRQRQPYFADLSSYGSQPKPQSRRKSLIHEVNKSIKKLQRIEILKLNEISLGPPKRRRSGSKANQQNQEVEEDPQQLKCRNQLQRASPQDEVASKNSSISDISPKRNQASGSGLRQSQSKYAARKRALAQARRDQTERANNAQKQQSPGNKWQRVGQQLRNRAIQLQKQILNSDPNQSQQIFKSPKKDQPGRTSQISERRDEPQECQVITKQFSQQYKKNPINLEQESPNNFQSFKNTDKKGQASEELGSEFQSCEKFQEYEAQDADIIELKSNSKKMSNQVSYTNEKSGPNETGKQMRIQQAITYEQQAQVNTQNTCRTNFTIKSNEIILRSNQSRVSKQRAPVHEELQFQGAIKAIQSIESEGNKIRESQEQERNELIKSMNEKHQREIQELQNRLHEEHSSKLAQFAQQHEEKLSKEIDALKYSRFERHLKELDEHQQQHTAKTKLLQEQQCEQLAHQKEKYERQLQLQGERQDEMNHRQSLIIQQLQDEVQEQKELREQQMHDYQQQKLRQAKIQEQQQQLIQQLEEEISDQQSQLIQSLEEQSAQKLQSKEISDSQQSLIQQLQGQVSDQQTLIDALIVSTSKSKEEKRNENEQSNHVVDLSIMQEPKVNEQIVKKDVGVQHAPQIILQQSETYCFEIYPQIKEIVELEQSKAIEIEILQEPEIKEPIPLKQSETISLEIQPLIKEIPQLQQSEAICLEIQQEPEVKEIIPLVQSDAITLEIAQPRLKPEELGYAQAVNLEIVHEREIPIELEYAQAVNLEIIQRIPSSDDSQGSVAQKETYLNVAKVRKVSERAKNKFYCRSRRLFKKKQREQQQLLDELDLKEVIEVFDKGDEEYQGANDAQVIDQDLQSESDQAFRTSRSPAEIRLLQGSDNESEGRNRTYLGAISSRPLTQELASINYSQTDVPEDAIERECTIGKPQLAVINYRDPYPARPGGANATIPVLKKSDITYAPLNRSAGCNSSLSQNSAAAKQRQQRGKRQHSILPNNIQILIYSYIDMLTLINHTSKLSENDRTLLIEQSDQLSQDFILNIGKAFLNSKRINLKHISFCIQLCTRFHLVYNFSDQLDKTNTQKFQQIKVFEHLLQEDPAKLRNSSIEFQTTDRSVTDLIQLTSEIGKYERCKSFEDITIVISTSANNRTESGYNIYINYIAAIEKLIDCFSAVKVQSNNFYITFNDKIASKIARVDFFRDSREDHQLYQIDEATEENLQE